MAKRPVLIVVAGPNGSGKTTLTEQVLADDWVHGCKYINPDNIARDVFGDWNSLDAVIKAANYADAEREKCLAEGHSLIFETVLSQYNKVDFIKRAASEGFFVRLFFVGTDSPSINASRVATRVAQGGHDVPIPKIIDRYAKSIANCVQASQVVNRAYIYDNSVDGELPRLLFRGANGTIVKTYGTVNEWARPIIDMLNEDHEHDVVPAGPPV